MAPRINTQGYKLEYYGQTPTTETMPDVKDISGYIETVDKFTDEGNGIVPSATIMLDARDSEFITNTNGGDTPRIEQYDLLQLTIQDNSGNTYSKFLVVDDVEPMENETGRHLVVEAFGRERYLQKMLMTGYFPFVTFKDMLVTLRDYYNANAGTVQPYMAFLSTDLDNVPPYAYGTFDFGKETTVFDALQEVIRRLSLPVAAGGGGERWSMIVDPNADTGDMGRNAFRIMVLRLVPRGTLVSTKAVISKPMNFTRVRSPERGTIAAVEGQPGSGSYPRNISEFRGLIEEYESIPDYDFNFPYKAGALARFSNGEVRQAVTDQPATGSTYVPPTAFQAWGRYRFEDHVANYKQWRKGASFGRTTNGIGFVGPVDTSFDYSPWTRQKSALWKAWGASDSRDSNRWTDAVPDSNLTIRETSTNGTHVTSVWRDWVDFLATSDSIDTTTHGSPYDGMRVLVIGAHSSGQFSGSDQFGKSYEDSMVQRVNGKWVVFREPHEFDQCAILDRGWVYSYMQEPTLLDADPVGVLKGIHEFISNIGAAVLAVTGYEGSTDARSQSKLAWRSAEKVLSGNDCFHKPSGYQNTTGLIAYDANDRTVVTSTYTNNSAIKIQYSFNFARDAVKTYAGKLTGGIIGPEVQPFDITTALVNIGSDIANLFGFGSQEEIPSAVEEIETTPEERAMLAGISHYNNGWWATLFEAPFPKTKRGTPYTESIGDLYDGGTFSLYNLNQTPSGAVGYSNDDSQDLGQLEGIGFYFRFNIENVPIRDFLGNIPFRVVMYDIFGGVWKYDFVLRFQNETQFIRIPFSAFRSYRARLPVQFAAVNWLQRAKNPELRDTSIFDRHFMKRIVMHCLYSYDDQGRYDPWQMAELAYNVVQSFANVNATNYIGVIDGFHFLKTPLAVARGQDHTTRHTMDRIKQYPHISNFVQLQKIARAELDIAQHQDDIVEFQLENQQASNLPCELRAEQTIIIHDNKFFGNTETVGGHGNRREYIIDKITYTIGDRTTTSGLIATIKASRKVAT